MRCPLCHQRVLRFLAYGDKFPPLTVLRFHCGHCGARIRPSVGTVLGALALVALLFAIIPLAERLSDRLGLVERFLRGLLYTGCALPALLPLAWLTWSRGQFVLRGWPTVNGLPLPLDLVDLMRAGRWKIPTDRSGVDRLFPKNGGLYPYGIDLMESEARAFFLPALQGAMWLGVPDSNDSPGDIDPYLSVPIADLGLGYDQPIALDYRVSREQPQVITLRCSERGDRSRWVVVAPNIRSFAELVGM